MLLSYARAVFYALVARCALDEKIIKGEEKNGAPQQRSVVRLEYIITSPTAAPHNFFHARAL